MVAHGLWDKIASKCRLPLVSGTLEGEKKNRRKKRLLEVACYRFQRLRMEMVLAFSPSGNFPGEHQLPPLCAGQGKVQGIIARSSRKERRK
jgi:hypothetical protein